MFSSEDDKDFMRLLVCWSMSDLFAVARLGRAGVVLAGLSFSTCDVSDIWWGIIKTIVSAMSFYDVVCGCSYCAVLEYCYMWFEFHDAKLGPKWNDVFYMPDRYAYGEMEAAYNERVDFIKELEAVPGVDAAVKTAEFLNDALEIIEDLRLAREINVLCAHVTAIIDQREMFVDELEMLAGRHVPDKMADFMNQVQGKDISNLMKLQILKREFELSAQKKAFSLRT
uniref:Uncharacterized protein n=1 Tax=Tanacetum cinerariifolium TaxID=118510 RepID=A0A6L2LML1_TANCI|nr:hypothetical protein [Tanacetum cinerariifolium]